MKLCFESKRANVNNKVSASGGFWAADDLIESRVRGWAGDKLQ